MVPKQFKAELPAPITDWFTARSWSVHRHQLEMLAADRAGQSALLIAPTGGGKTLAGFLPTLADLADAPHKGLHTLYISPLKALAADVERNLSRPVADIGLDITIESRTGDTTQAARKRQRSKPPNILLTTPESLALLLSYEDAPALFSGLQRLVIDELHALADNKRGQLLSLAVARLKSLSPDLRVVGLSATVHDPDYLQAWLGEDATRVVGDGGSAPKLAIQLPTKERMPWSGHMALRTMPDVYELIKNAKTAIVFVNTRGQAELTFQELWRLNEDGLAIGLHHGSLEKKQRLRVEAAMASGMLQGVVATSSLDLGIDWGAVDLVIQVGAPKGVARMLQRIGRSNHRMNEASQAVMVPGNRFEVLECQACIDGIRAHTLDGPPPVPGGLDVLAQHIVGRSCCAPFTADELFTEVTRALPYRDLPRKDFDDVLSFVQNGGYALKVYDRFHKLAFDPETGCYQIAGTEQARRYRMNVGTIIEETTVKVRKKGGRTLGRVEEYFAQMLVPGDTFIFAGELLAFEEIRDMSLIATRAITSRKEPKVPAYIGGRFPMTTHLSSRVRAMLNDPDSVPDLPAEVREWIEMQRTCSVLPDKDKLLIETFPRGDRYYMIAYTFEGRNAHQTLGMMLTKRMERLGYGPLGFVATDYVIGVWSVHRPLDMDALFDEDMLGDDLEAWMADSSLLKRTFRNCAMIAGLIEKNLPGQEKNTRQITFSTDLIYDTLRSHEPDHVLLRATRQDAASGLTDVGRLAEMLQRVKGKIQHQVLEKTSPLAVPVLLEIGRESVSGDAIDDLLAAGAGEALIEEALA